MGKKFEHHEEVEEGEGWLISYADLMTLLFGFFVLMYKAVSDDGRVDELQRKIGESLSGFDRPVMERVEKAASEERAARAFQLLLKMVEIDPQSAVGEIERRYASRKEAKALKEVFASEMGEKGIQDLSFKVDERLRIVIPTDTGFASGSAELLPQAAPKLTELVVTLQKLQDIAQVEVIGHTDDIPPKSMGPWTSNWTLSATRAATVGNFLMQGGMPPAKIRVSGAADTAPLIPLQNLTGKDLAEARTRNRRIEIIVHRDAPKPTTGGAP